MADRIGNYNQNAEQSQQLADIQRQQQKKRDEAVARGEAELKRVNDEYRARVAKAEEESRASINHIRETNDQKSEQLKHKGYENLKNLRAGYNEEMAKERSVLTDRYKIAADRVKQDHMKVEQQINDVQARDAREQKNRMEKLSEQRDRALESDKTARVKATEAYENARNKETEKLAEIKERSAKTLKSVNERNDRELQRAYSHHNETLDHLREKQNREIENFSEGSRKRSMAAQVDGERELNRIHDKYQEEVQRESVTNRQHIDQVRHENEQNLISQRNRNLTQTQKIQDDSQKQLHDLRERSQKEINQEQVEFDQRRKIAKESHDKELAKLIGNQEQDRTSRENEYKNQVEKDKELYRGNLSMQKKEFDKVYKQNDEFGRAALTGQRENIIRELSKQRNKLVTSLNRYKGLDEDPFYGVKHLNTELRETERSYVLIADIPKHLRKDINITVQKDKVRVSGNRTFQEDLMSERKDHRVKTDSYQTFNEEFAFQVPVLEKKVIERYNDGKLELIIPKAGTILT